MARYDLNSKDAMWRMMVKTRDNNTCKSCGVERSPYYLHAHHIFSYSDNPMLRTDVNNGISLCSKCHKAFHDRFGRGGNTRYQLEQFLKSGVKKVKKIKKLKIRKFKIKHVSTPQNYNQKNY